MISRIEDFSIVQFVLLFPRYANTNHLNSNHEKTKYVGSFCCLYGVNFLW